MKNTAENKIIFDMDGTLYHMDGKKGQTFTSSRFYGDIKTNIQRFLGDRLSMTPEEAERARARVSDKYKGEISLGLEAEFGIPRADYFQAGWDLQAEDYLEPDPGLRKELEVLRGRIALLTASPRIWAIRALAFLDVEDLFDGRIFTGEPDLRKPNPAVFQTVAWSLNAYPDSTISIGDQEQSDIVPAKSIGMKAVRIGPGVTIADFRADDVRQALRILRGGGLV